LDGNQKNIPFGNYDAESAAVEEQRKTKPPMDDMRDAPFAHAP
jgi:hypothetical protein